MNEGERKRKLFKYLKENRVNQNIIHAIDKLTKKKVMVSISPDGELYDKNGSNMDKVRARRYWNALYFYALSNAYNIVPEGYLHET